MVSKRTQDLSDMVTSTKLARQFGRQAFGENPASYHSSRPEYPEWVYATLASGCGLRRNAAVFEIGAGTGTATRRLLDLGADPLTAVEPDQRLADFLRTNNPDKALTMVVAAFEDASLEEEAFDLGVSFTAFHWLDEDSALVKIASLFAPVAGGRQFGTCSAMTADPIGFTRRPRNFWKPLPALQPGQWAFPSDWIPWLAWLP